MNDCNAMQWHSIERPFFFHIDECCIVELMDEELARKHLYTERTRRRSVNNIAYWLDIKQEGKTKASRFGFKAIFFYLLLRPPLSPLFESCHVITTRRCSATAVVSLLVYII